MQRAVRTLADLVAALRLDEKASLTVGATTWATAAVERLGIPSVQMTDGPAGARGPMFPGVGEQRPTLCIPCGSALGATWDADLIEHLGAAVGDQALAQGARVLLAPTVNLHRSPLAGRNFEAYSEDPLLAGTLAAAFVRGVQSNGVATTVKHLAGNEAEFERMTINSSVDERTLRELYLVPFEMAVREGGTLGIMTAYNRLNGTYCAEHVELLAGIVRGEWGFDGFVVSDWYAAADPIASSAAGLDLEMPAPARAYGERLAEAVRAGDVDEVRLDEIVGRLLGVFERIGALDAVEGPAGGPADRPEHRTLARRAAAGSMVLLRNEGILPLDRTGLRSLAVIGPNADRARIMGGGSAEVLAHPHRAPLEALRARLGAAVDVSHEVGCDIDRTIAPVPTAWLQAPDGRPGFTLEVFAGEGCTGEVVATNRRPDGRLLLVPHQDDGIPAGAFSFRARTRLRPETSGAHRLTLIQIGPTRVRLDGTVVLDGVAEPPPPGDAYFGLGRQEVGVEVDLDAERGHDLVVECVRAGGELAWLHGASVGAKAVLGGDALARAAELAAAADVALVVVGTNQDWESEGHDRASLDLPGAQAELIERVAAANPRTVVVVNAGAPVAMGWVDRVPAALQVWFGGQEMGEALVDVLLGDADPGGRLPTTFPERVEHTAAYGNFPGEHGEVRYGEGVLMGYRWHEARHLEPRFAFGHGLSYTSFAIGPPSIDADVVTAGDPVTVDVEVTNTGARAGTEVVQCYVGALAPSVVRPPKELKAFAKVALEPGGSTTVSFTLGPRAFAHWDPGDRSAGPERTGPLPARAPRSAGWRIDPGPYAISVGRASDAIAHRTTLTLTEPPGQHDAPHPLHA